MESQVTLQVLDSPDPEVQLLDVFGVQKAMRIVHSIYRFASQQQQIGQSEEGQIIRVLQSTTDKTYVLY